MYRFISNACLSSLTAGITVSHVLYGLKANFTYNLNHQNNSIGRSFFGANYVMHRTVPRHAQQPSKTPNRCNNFVYIQTYQAHTTVKGTKMNLEGNDKQTH